MAISISPRKISLDQEKKIITNLITNTDYCRQIIPILENDSFETPFCRKISNWIREYFQEYQEAPSKTIQTIFNSEKVKLQESESELVYDFLSNLSNEFEEDKEKQNTNYLVKLGAEYLRKRHYAVLGEKLQAFSKIGDITECEKTLLKHKNISSSKIEYVNLHDENTVKDMIVKKESDFLFTIDGALGELIGPIERGRLYGILGKTNIGKSWILREILFQALLKRIKCVEFNFEMKNTSVGWRHYKRILGRSEEEKQFLFPLFDCKHNATGTCRKKERKCKVSLYNDLGEIPEYGKQHKDYIPCDVCRGNDKDYKLSIWHESLYKKAITSGAIEKGVKAFKMMYGDNLRTVCFPKFSATVADCFHQLDMMEYIEDFIPDFGIYDYDEIIKPETIFENPIYGSDEIYKRICGEQQKRDMAGFIGLQLNKTGAKKKKGSIFDAAGLFTKIMHLDGVIILDQTEKEHDAGILRASIGKMRDGQFKVGKQVKILQQLSTGQSYLDSEWDEMEYEE